MLDYLAEPRKLAALTFAAVLPAASGNAKLIDIGSAIDLRGATPQRMWSPAYAAPEVLRAARTRRART